jgi:hypothetical protein
MAMTVTGTVLPLMDANRIVHPHPKGRHEETPPPAKTTQQAAALAVITV